MDSTTTSTYQVTMDGLNYIYRDFWDEYGADCVKDLPLLSGGPWKVLVIVAIYLWFVKVKGPQIMKDRPPMYIKPFVVAHNVFLVLVHACLFPLAVWATDYFRTCWQCRPINIHDPVNGHKEYIALMLGYVYFLTKFFELADTVFFILKKKDSHVSTLHVFHHSSMPVFCYIGAKFSAWHCVGWIAMLNAFVHIVMYSYYTLAALGVQRWLWMKKHITQLQILQFLLILIHAVYFLQLRNCDWPKFINIMELIHGVQFLYMFSSFYVRTYWRNKPAAAAGDRKKNNNGTTANGSQKKAVVNGKEPNKTD